MASIATHASGLNHLGIAVASIAEARTFYETVLGAVYEGEETVADQRVRTAFFRVGEGPTSVRIELLEPTSDDSPVAKFLAKRGPGLHHVAYTVDDVQASLAEAERAGMRLIDSTPRRGAHGAEIAFLHPQSTGGLLTELCRPATDVSLSPHP
jgi:methylmalonyl-CoA/ethylmalonyl-CoA epimerase